MGSCLSVSEMPLVGEISNTLLFQLIPINNKKFGKARESIGVYEIEISENPRGLDVGRIMKTLLFSDYPDFILNVLATSSRVKNGKSNYPNPRSHWFNVFYGFYQIDIPQSKINHPFGFELVIDEFKVTENSLFDILKLGLCDWNILTSYMYGVPLEKCRENTRITGNEKFKITDIVKIGKLEYYEVEFSNVIATSVYPAKSKLDSGIINNFLQKSWGKYKYIPGYDEAFPSVNMSGRFYITFTQTYSAELDEMCYSTIVGGGVVNQDFPDSEYNKDFLNLQMNAVVDSILLNNIS